MPDEDAEIPHRLVDPIASLDLRKIASAALVADVFQAAVGEDAAAGFLDGLFADVRSENLDRVLARGLSEKLEQGDGHGVHLLPGRAPRGPQSNGVPRRLVLQNFREDVRLEVLEDLCVPEKGRDVDEKVLIEGMDLLRVLSKKLQIPLLSIHSAQSHPAGQSSLESGRLVFAEVDADGASHHDEDLVERRVVVGGGL